MIFLTKKGDIMIKVKYKQLCLHRQFGSIYAIAYTQTLAARQKERKEINYAYYK